MHKSWPTTMSDSESVLDPGPGSGEGACLSGSWGQKAAWAWGGLTVQAGLGRVYLP